MNDLRTAAQQALEFVTSERWGTTPYMDVCVYEDAARLREALRAALAQQDEPMEPVAWADRIAFESAMNNGKGCDVWPNAGDYVARTGRAVIRLYTAPPPPQRKPLTEDDLRKLADKHLFYQLESYEASGVFALSRAVERAVWDKGVSMTTQSDALRLAEALEAQATWVPSDPASVMRRSAAELRRLSAENDLLGSAADKLRVAWRDEVHRLHAENASLAAALASSCDEQRHQLWESGGVAGCERARVAERQRDALLEALKKADQFITNGIELGFIRMPDAETPDSAHETPGIARAVIKAVEENT